MPPPQRRAMDEIDIGELVRNLAALSAAVERINDKLDNLSMQFTPREVHDLALGGVKIDIRRIDEQSSKDAEELRREATELDARLDTQDRTVDARFAELERETARRFRQLVTIIATSVLGPLTVALVLYVLTSLPGGGLP